MGMNGKRLGHLLMEADIVTKRQLAKAIQKQTKGDTRKLGEILVELEYLTIEDLTEVMMEQDNQTKPKKSIDKNQPAPPPELSKAEIMNTKFTLSVQTMIGAAVGISSLIGMWYALQADIQEAKELPRPTAIYNNEYPSKSSGHN